MDLNEAHKAQIARYLSFFKGKRERLLADRESEKAEFVSDRLSDAGAIFNNQDTIDLIENYHAQLIGSIREELEKVINLAAVYLSQVFQQAERQYGISMDGADVSLVEDQNRLQQIAVLASGNMAPPPLPARPALHTLPTLQPAGTDIALAQELQDLKTENLQLKDRFQKMTTETHSLLEERSQLSGELEKVKANFEMLRHQMHASGLESSSSPHVIDIERSLNDTKVLLASKNEEVGRMKAEMQQRLGDSTQFKELKAIVKKKSQEVIMLRRFLEQNGLPPPVAQGGIDLPAED